MKKKGENWEISFTKTKKRLQKNAIRTFPVLPYKTIYMKVAKIENTLRLQLEDILKDEVRIWTWRVFIMCINTSFYNVYIQKCSLFSKNRKDFQVIVCLSANASCAFWGAQPFNYEAGKLEFAQNNLTVALSSTLWDSSRVKRDGEIQVTYTVDI